jgi:hypothetical protein
MAEYRVWIGVSVKNQKFTNQPIEKGVFRYFANDKDAEKWAKNRVLRLVNHIAFYSSAKYAIRTLEGNYLMGKVNQNSRKLIRN